MKILHPVLLTLLYLAVAGYAMLALFLIVGAWLPARRQRGKEVDESPEKDRRNYKATILRASRIA